MLKYLIEYMSENNMIKDQVVAQLITTLYKSGMLCLLSHCVKIMQTIT